MKYHLLHHKKNKGARVLHSLEVISSAFPLLVEFQTVFVSKEFSTWCASETTIVIRLVFI